MLALGRMVLVTCVFATIRCKNLPSSVIVAILLSGRVRVWPIEFY